MASTIHYTLKPGGQLTGCLQVPGDKSVSHRSIMLGSLTDGAVLIDGFLEGADALATLAAFRAMGVQIEGPHAGKVRIQGVGIDGLRKPAHPLDLGNSGTSMRLLAGLLSGQSFDCVLTGDESLSQRPMRRVIEPLTQMGASIDASARGTAPLHIHGTKSLTGINYDLPVASAQVKSCVLLAGLYARGTTCVQEPAATRDHTERMLQAFAYPVIVSPSRVCVHGGGRLRASAIQIPADLSAAAFFLVGAAIAAGSDLTLSNVGINPTRTGVIHLLQLMGAQIEINNTRMIGGEPIADLRIRAARLQGIDIPESLVPLAIDEFPALFIAAACAEGTTRLTGASELRVKESDRIQVMADGLNTLGIDATPTQDGIVIQGGQIQGGQVDSHKDHRIAMAFAMAALRARSTIQVLDCENVNTSFPGFVALAQRAGLHIVESST